MKTMHAYTVPEALSFGPRTYRRLNYQRSVRAADAVVVNSNSLRAEIDRYLDVEPHKVSLIYEAVDHDIFKPGDRDAARAHVASFGVTRPFVLFVSSLWRYKKCDGLLRAWKRARHELAGRQLVVLGPQRDEKYVAELLPSSALVMMSSSSVASRTRRPPSFIKQPTFSFTLRSARPSDCRSSRQWPVRVQSSPPTRARCLNSPAGRRCSQTPTTRHHWLARCLTPPAMERTRCEPWGSVGLRTSPGLQSHKRLWPSIGRLRNDGGVNELMGTPTTAP